MNVDSTLLSQFLTWLVAGGGAGVFGYFLMEKVQFLAQLSSEAKRYVSLGLAALVAMAAFVLAVGFGYVQAPTTAQGWVEALFAVSFIATNLSQVIHGRVKLRD